jgi:hypothetical protein
MLTPHLFFDNSNTDLAPVSAEASAGKKQLSKRAALNLALASAVISRALYSAV